MTNNATEEYTKKASKARGLSVKDALSIGFKGLFRRKIRLFISVLMAWITFVMFGVILSLASYDRAEIYLNAMYDSDNYYFNITNSVMAEYLDDQDMDYLKQKTGADELFFSYDMSRIRVSNSLGLQPNTSFYQNASLTGFMELNKNIADKFQFDLLFGEFPSTDNEIVVTEYIFDFFVASGYYAVQTDEVIKIEKHADLINKSVGDGYIISGVLDTHFNFDKYDILKKPSKGTDDDLYSNTEEKYYNLINGFSSHTIIFVNDGYFSRNPYDGIFAAAVPLSGSTTKDARLIGQFNPDSIFDHPKFYRHSNDIAASLFELDEILSDVSLFLIVATAVFAILAFVTLLTFFTNVFNDEERTIKILRALGANTKSIFLIFFLLPLAISLFNFSIATIASLIISNFLNAKIRSLFLFDFSLINLGFIQIALMLILSLVTALLSAIIPLKKRSLL